VITRRTLVATALGTTLLGCKSRKRPTRAHDRVVSLSPSTTETMFAIGAGGLLVGRSDHCDYPAEAQSLPSVGGFASPNLEAVLALRPTIVIGSQSPVGPTLAEQLEGYGVDTLFPPTKSVAEILAMMHQLGARFGTSDGATRAVRKVERRVEDLKAWAAARPKRSVVLVFDPRPLFVAGPGSFADELVRLAGGDNAITEGGLWPTIDEERLVALDPDVIVDATMAPDAGGRSRLPERPGWQTLTAVREDRVRRLRSDAALRPGPRIGQGLRDLAQAIHGVTPP
jgi:iron complex transport system substrate-binding protein